MSAFELRQQIIVSNEGATKATEWFEFERLDGGSVSLRLVTAGKRYLTVICTADDWIDIIALLSAKDQHAGAIALARDLHLVEES